MANKSVKHNSFNRAISMPLRAIIKAISPRFYVRLEYRYITGHLLHLRKPIKYTEKLQYLRLFSFPKDPLVSQCASRDGLREYAKECGFENNLVPLIGIYDSVDQIDFNALPTSFVIKCTHASGFNEIVHNKNTIDINKLKKKFSKWLKIDYGKQTVEPHYSKISPKIIIENLIYEHGILPTEYKIHVFNGVAKYMYVVTDRNVDIRYNNYYIDWTPFDDAQFNHWTKSDKTLSQPENWNEMVKIAEKLAEKFPFVRVDLYSIEGKIYISEMTFTPAKGTLVFDGGEKIDYKIGEWLNLPKLN